MSNGFDVHAIEEAVRTRWDGFVPKKATSSAQQFSTFLTPPNASGPLHIGNAFDVIFQDTVVRYQRSRGVPVTWIPGADHGGYETQVTYEREVGEETHLTRHELKEKIASFAQKNIEIIKAQLQAIGASVDRNQFRYTLDADASAFVQSMFTKMVNDNLIYRDSYMVNYCPSCKTMLADIELKETEGNAPLYFVRFPFKNKSGYLVVTTTEPEVLFSVTHLLIRPTDPDIASCIGETLINPITGSEVLAIESKRRFKGAEEFNPVPVFAPSARKYDFEYAIRHKLPSTNLLDWNGLFIMQYPGCTREEARKAAVQQLTHQQSIERVEETVHTAQFCKKGHAVVRVIRMTWFLDLDGKQVSIRKQALEALTKESLYVWPQWRKKGIVEWIGKMHHWPITRQNVWGLPVPVWYDVSNSAPYTVWFRNAEGELTYGHLGALLEKGISLETIQTGLERIYADEGCVWTLTPDPTKAYLPETDTFDTWFSSDAWNMFVYAPQGSLRPGIGYPSSFTVAGHELLRLYVARAILLATYLTGQLPFKRVQFHQLLRGRDGQKMSKSLGNAIALDTLIQTYGTDVTRMTLLARVEDQQDFMISAAQSVSYQEFSSRLWRMGQKCKAIIGYMREGAERTTAIDPFLLTRLHETVRRIDADMQRYALATAQTHVLTYLHILEQYMAEAAEGTNIEQAALSVARIFKAYLILLHPFMPFLTEHLYATLYTSDTPLAHTRRSEIFDHLT